MSGASLETVRQNIAANAVASPVGVELVAKQSGAYRGEAVMNSDQDSKVAQANHQLKTSFKAQNLQTLAQRMAAKGRGTHLNAASKIADFYEKLPNMPDTEKLKSLVETIHEYMLLLEEEANEAGEKEDGEAGEPGGEGEERESGSQDAGREGKEAIFAALQQFDPDVSHQSAALDIVREHFKNEEAAPELLNLLDEAGRHFEQHDVARDVRAGFSAAHVAKANAATLETDPATVRNTYRSMLQEEPNFGRLFDALSSKFNLLKNPDAIIETFRTAADRDLVNVDAAIEKLRTAAGRDLASTGPLADSRFLHGLLTELGKLKKIQTVLDESSKLITQTERILPEKSCGVLKPVQVASRMLNFVAKPTVNLGDARTLLGGLEKAGAGGQVVFVNGLQHMHGLVADEVFPSFQARLQQKTTLKSLSNGLVEAEEREFEKSQEQHV